MIELIVTGVLFVAVMLTVLTGGYQWEKYSCHTRADLMKKERIYRMVSGCMIETEQGIFIPIDQYRTLAD